MNPAGTPLVPDTQASQIKTVVFADISGSTALYDALGNAEATRAVTTLTRQMGLAIKNAGGRVVKKLGDGVLGVFGDGAAAAAGVVELMREQHLATRALPQSHRLAVRVGLCSGEVVEVDGDTYGDAVNVAARLCEIAAPGEILASQETVQTLPKGLVALVRMGHMEVRGKSDPVLAYQLEWREDETTDFMTVQGGLPSEIGALGVVAAHGKLDFDWRGTQQSFMAAAGTLYIGRGANCHVRVDDPRVSRMHARVDWRQGSAVLTDLSSFGTWVRFADGAAPVQLRRESCLLHGAGEIAMSVPFADAAAPVLRFGVSSMGALSV
ncbi:FHA domain-containing protein [Comamonas sp. NLF-1-9]|nr:FHA domain-containing protein [Comamonas sp. NLF-1-9]